jgi:hypothetical protein
MDEMVKILIEQNEFSGNEWFQVAADEIERLRAELVSKADELAATVRQLRKVQDERDEARRWLCQVLAKPEFVTGLAKPGQGRPHDFAKEQGWDCFKENTR